MAGRAVALAAIAGIAVGFIFGGLKEGGSSAFPMAFLIGSLAAATSFGVSMVLFIVTMPRLDPRIAVWISLGLGALAAFAIGAALHPIARPA